MEENNENKVNTDEILKETSNTFNEVKDQVKGSFKKDELKNSATQTKNFIIGMFKDPVGELKRIADGTNTTAFKYAVILVAVWMVARAITSLANASWTLNIFGRILLPLIKTIAAPILSVLVLSVTILVLNKNKDKSLVTILSVVTAAKLPLVISAVVSLLKLISYKVSTVTSPFASVCSIVSTVLVYFGAKSLLGEEEDDKFIRTFVVIEVIYYVAYIVLDLLGIYI